MTIKRIEVNLSSSEQMRDAVALVDALTVVDELMPGASSSLYDESMIVSQTVYDKFKRPLGKLIIRACDDNNVYGSMLMTDSPDEYGILEAHMGHVGPAYTSDDSFIAVWARQGIENESITVTLDDEKHAGWGLCDPAEEYVTLINHR